MATLSPPFFSASTILVSACAREGVLCRLATVGRPATEALVSQREQELVVEVERVPTADFHVCIYEGDTKLYVGYRYIYYTRLSLLKGNLYKEIKVLWINCGTRICHEDVVIDRSKLSETYYYGKDRHIVKSCRLVHTKI
jgi:hypothetical protein